MTISFKTIQYAGYTDSNKNGVLNNGEKGYDPKVDKDQNGITIQEAWNDFYARATNIPTPISFESRDIELEYYNKLCEFYYEKHEPDKVIAISREMQQAKNIEIVSEGYNNEAAVECNINRNYTNAHKLLLTSLKFNPDNKSALENLSHLALKFFENRKYNSTAICIADIESYSSKRFHEIMSNLTKAKLQKLVGLVNIAMAEKSIEKAIEYQRQGDTIMSQTLITHCAGIIKAHEPMAKDNEELRNRLEIDKAYILYHGKLFNNAIQKCQAVIKSDPQNQKARQIIELARIQLQKQTNE